MRSTSKIEWELAIESSYQDMYKKIDAEHLKRLQAAYLEMFILLNRKCSKIGLKPLMVAGTLIGSLRHKGYIPWDDDIDLVLSRQNYEQLKSLLKDDEDFVLIDPSNNTSGIHKMLKIQSRSLSLFDVMGEGFSKSKFLYLDMLPIDYVPDNSIKRKIIGTIFKCLDYSYSSCRCFKKYSPHLNYMANGSNELRKNLFIRKCIGFPAYLLGPHRVFKLMEKLLMSVSEGSDMTIAYGVKGYFGEVVSKEVFFSGSRVFVRGEVFLWTK